MTQFSLTEMNLLYSSARTIAEGGDLNRIIKSILISLELETNFSEGSLAIIRDGHISIHTAESSDARDLFRPALERVIHRHAPLTQAGFSRDKLIKLAPGMTLIAVPILNGSKAAGSIGALKRGIANREELEHEVSFLTAVAELIAGTLLTRLQQEHSLTELQEENAELRRTLFRLEEQGRSSAIIGESVAIRQVFREIAQVAQSDTTVLIRGETGSGKELVARAIHDKSSCANGPFVALNCGALPDSLLESELFGYEKGAFTGAQSSRGGRFEEADGGTLFLDEIGELSLDAQTRLLRVIQEKEVARVGGGKSRAIAVRLVCATNRDLEKALSEGRFREDLYYRINVFPLTIPPLRERTDDIPLLVTHFLSLALHNTHHSRFEISTEAMETLCNYQWPGNVRELGNTIERATLVTATGSIGIEHLPFHVLPTMEHFMSRRSLEYQVEEFEKVVIENALKACKGNQTKAATYLETTKRILQYKIEKYQIDFRKFKSSNLQG